MRRAPHDGQNPRRLLSLVSALMSAGMHDTACPLIGKFSTARTVCMPQ
jgi:hypothetical protein